MTTPNELPVTTTEALEMGRPRWDDSLLAPAPPYQPPTRGRTPWEEAEAADAAQADTSTTTTPEELA